ncbi:MAG: DegT/DnrJ/EryC1/StrS family aminotransferase [Promethearchaeota archaeon]
MEKLAIDGGKQAVPPDLTLETWPELDEDDILSVVETLKSKRIWGSDAPAVLTLEEEWAKFCGATYCRGTNAGTAALHMALAGSGVGPGDEVIVPAYTYHSSASAILHHNAIPRFIDIDLDTFTLDPSRLDPLINEKTKAIIAVDLFGLPANWPEINRIAKANGIFTVEDACQAHGAAIAGNKTGTLADAAGFSLNGSKNLSGAEGGFFVTNNKEIYTKAMQLEMTVRTIDGKRVYPKYSFGWNYRMNPLSAALTRSQLRKLERLNQARRDNCERLSQRLEKLEGVIPPKVPPGYTHVYHMYRISLDTCLSEKYDVSIKEMKENVVYFLQSEGVRTSTWVQNMLPEMDMYQIQEGYGNGCPWSCPFGRGEKIEYKPSDYPQARMLLDSTFNVESLHPPNGFNYVDGVALAFEKIWNKLDVLMD